MLLVIILFAVPRYTDPNSAEPFRYVDRTCCFSQASHFLDDPTCGLVAQTEAQFTLRGISADETKYYHVVSVLDQETATRLLA